MIHRFVLDVQVHSVSPPRMNNSLLNEVPLYLPITVHYTFNLIPFASILLAAETP